MDNTTTRRIDELVRRLPELQIILQEGRPA
jgi:hypothetical protein